jgi:alpha-tubulin suppressor-like RCC1 family protein
MFSYGQIGDGSITNRPFPVAVSTSGVLSGKIILQITAGGGHTCAIANDLNSYCWGSNG